MKRRIISNIFWTSFCLLLLCRPLCAQDWFEQGLSFLHSGHYNQAIEAFTKTLEIVPHDYEAYNNRGIAWLYKGDYNRAISDFTEALVINPKYFQAYNNRGGAWIYKGNYDRAINDFTRALDFNPADFEAYHNRGGAWLYRNNYELAIADYTKALEINPDFDVACNQLSKIYSICPDVRYRDGVKAVDLALRAVELQPGAEYLDTLATAYAQTGKFEDAIKTQERAIALLKEEGNTGIHTEYIKRLNAYKANKPWWKDAVEISKTGASASHNGTDDNKNRSQPEKRKPRASRAKATGGSIAASKKIYSIQVGAYVDMQNAKKMIKQLKEKDYDARLFVRSDTDGMVWYKVLIGKYTNRQEAQEFANAFSAKEEMASIVSKIDEF